MGALTIKSLAAWGFIDSNRDGRVSLEELPHYKNRKLEANQKKAFQLLARLAGDANSLEQKDLDRLNTDPYALSQVMNEDPEYRSDLMSRAVLEQGKTQAQGLGSQRRDGIPPIAFKRLMTFSQLALNHYGLRTPVNGNYDATTAHTVNEFQNHFRLQSGRDGSFIDRSTFGALILSNQYNPANLKESIESIGLWLKKQSPKAFLLDNYEQSHPQQKENIKAYADLILSTLQYLYPDEVPPWKTEGRRDEANQCLSSRFKTAWISPDTLNLLAQALATHIPPR